MANERARQLRKTMTPQEVKLRVRLREYRDDGFHFRRQVPLDGYILDFVCFGSRLIVELDGGQHGLQAQLSRDRRRDDHFARHGFRFLRFWNTDIDRNLEGVRGVIADALQSPPPRPPSAGDPPRKGEGLY